MTFVATNDDAGVKDALEATKVKVPTISQQPASTTVSSGQPASFSVAASSTVAMTYQWMRGGAAIAGATSARYTLPSAQSSDSGAAFSVVVRNSAGTTTSTTARLTVNVAVVAAQAASARRPFSDRSPWNARPTRFTLGSFQIPTSLYYPTVAEGSYSVGVFETVASDPAITVVGPAGSNGIYVADAETFVPSITIPHWPSNVVPASGGDGHADIVDAAANRIHSFWQLRLENGTWRASQYTWTPLDGRGFGAPGQYISGTRAAGVVTMAGLIRKHEIDDGASMYKHALAMSLTNNALASTNAYMFPATTADHDAATANTGSIPEGALMVLPANFDVSSIADAKLRKVAATLQAYGAYVVDRNYGTPFAIYVELGSGFNLMPNGWDNGIAADLERLRAALRQVTSVTEWVDATNTVFVPETKLNLLSMRGFWWPLQGGTAAPFDTWEQAVVFPNNGTYTLQVNAGGRAMSTVSWAVPTAGKTYKVQVKGAGGATFRLDLATSNGTVVYSTGNLQDGASLTFTWPQSGLTAYTYAASGAAGGGKVGATLIEQ